MKSPEWHSGLFFLKKNEKKNENSYAGSTRSLSRNRHSEIF